MQQQQQEQEHYPGSCAEACCATGVVGPCPQTDSFVQVPRAAGIRCQPWHGLMDGLKRAGHSVPAPGL